MAQDPAYCRSTDGNDADNGTTWALADASLSGGAADSVAGGKLWVSHVHNESNAAAQTIALPGTPGSPTLVLCGNDGAEPPTALATSGVVTTTGNSSITVTGSGDIEGITFNCGTGAVAPTLGLNASAAHRQRYKNCKAYLLATGASARMRLGFGSTGSSETALHDTDFKVSASGQAVLLCQRVLIQGGAYVLGTSPSSAFGASDGRPVNADIIGHDMSALNAAVNLVATSTGANCSSGRIVFSGCKMPASWSGDLESAAIVSPGLYIAMHACDNADGMYYERSADCFGKSREETTYTRSGGRTVPNSRSGGTDPQPLSFKLDGTGRLCAWPSSPFIFQLEPIFNTATGSSKTITVPILVDSASEWNDNDIVLRVRYPGTAGETRYSMSDSGPSSTIAAATDLNTKFGASSGWTTTSLTNPKQRQLQVTFTPQEKGDILCEILLYKQSAVYVDEPSLS